MHPALALALRRAAFAAAALAITLGGHAFTADGFAVRPAAPVLWALLLLVAALCGGHRRFRARSFPATGAILIAAQALLHVAMTGAPWLFGIAPHHPPELLIDVRSAALHGAVALVLALMLHGLDRALATAVAVIRRLRGIWAAACAARFAERVAPSHRPPLSREAAGPRSSRGPPARTRVRPVVLPMS
ncbi:MAG: hypothetical protein AB7V42_05535 [Thermoleophilia bacterium]